MTDPGSAVTYSPCSSWGLPQMGCSEFPAPLPSPVGLPLQLYTLAQFVFRAWSLAKVGFMLCHSRRVCLLRALEQGAQDRPVALPPEACKSHTPLKVEAWKDLLREHPDRWFADFILRGIAWVIGFHGEQLATGSNNEQ